MQEMYQETLQDKDNIRSRFSEAGTALEKFLI